MKSTNRRLNILAATLTIAFASCDPPKTIYLSNKTGVPVLLTVQQDTGFSTNTQQRAFRDSLHGMHIVSGHRVLSFGKGNWSERDGEDLKVVLSKTSIQLEGETEMRPVPSSITVNHYKLFVEELLVRFRSTEQND